MSKLSLSLLGPFQATLDGQPLPKFRTTKAQALLIYLASQYQKPQRRAALMELLWPGLPEISARANLRQSLYLLRQVLPDLTEETPGGIRTLPLISGDHHTLQINPEVPVEVDTRSFTAWLEQARSHPHPDSLSCLECSHALEKAVALYCGDFLSDFYLDDSAEFEEWAAVTRENLRRQALEALDKLVEIYLYRREFPAARACALRQVEIDNLHESAYRQLMLVEALSGQRAEALSIYERFRRLLSKELNVAPAAATTALFEQIQAGEDLAQTLNAGTRLAERGHEGLDTAVPGAHRQPRKVGPCPYRGLSAFREADAPFYFGREDFVKALEQAVLTKRLVAVIVGSSGSGKSSALFAGLLPRLRKEDGYQFAAFRPGNQPFYALAGALLPLLEPGLSETDRLVETGKLGEALAEGGISLSQVVERILEKNPGTRQVLLMVDQFEELYTLCPDVALQNIFIEDLLAAVETGRIQHEALSIILMTIRADFMGQALAHRPFADALQEASLLMGPMNRAELRMAIERPAELQGAAFEAGLVERILDDVGEKPGNLPLLEFTLTQLWERQSDGWLAHADYEGMGCVDGALASYADQVYAGLDENEQERARHALVQLVQPGEGTEDTRRIATKEELGEQSWQLIQRLADRRLVVTGRDARGRETAEVVHEALIQKWGRFQDWMESDRAFRAWQERLRAGLRGWQESGQDDGALLAGAPLALAQNWLAERGSQLSPAESGYIQASQALQARRQKESQRRRQRTFAGLAAGLVLALVLAAFAFIQRQNAVAQREKSLRQAAILLAGQAETELANGYHDRAVLLALEALENYPYTPNAERALARAVSYNRAVQVYTGLTGAVTSLDWSPDGKRIASSSSENRVNIWDPATGETLLEIEMPTGITGNIQDMALQVRWTPDGEQLLTLNGDRLRYGSQDYDLLFWDADSGKEISRVEISNQAKPEVEIMDTRYYYLTGSAAAFAPHSGRLATLGGDNTAIIWEADGQAAKLAPELVLSGHIAGVTNVDWSPDETRLVTASEDGTAVLWDAQTGKKIQTLSGHKEWVNTAVWSPSGELIATAGEDGTLRLWDAASGELSRTIQTEAGAVASLAWAPNGARLASGQRDGRLLIWEVASGELLESLCGHEASITDLKWSPVDNRLASADMNGNVRVWNAAYTTAWRLYPPQEERGGLWCLADGSWSRDSRYLAVAGGSFRSFKDPPSLAIWDVYDNRLLKEDMVAALNLSGVWARFSPDDRWILYEGLKGYNDLSGMASAYVFDAHTGKISKTITPGGDHLIRGLAWSRDGTQVATGLMNNQIILWDVQSGKPVQTLVHGTDELMMVNYIEWSPDGSRLASASDDSTARVWDARTWEPIFTVHHEPPTVVYSLSWSPDGKRLLTTAGAEYGARDTTARVWDAASGKQILVFRGHTEAIHTGVWSPDGQRIATFANDGTVRVWDAATGYEVLVLDLPVFLSSNLSWSPDGLYLLVTGDDTLISVWRVWQTTAELLDYAKECCVFRELTEAERVQFGLR